MSNSPATKPENTGKRLEESQSVIIRTIGLVKRYGIPCNHTYALNNVDTRIYRGEFVALLGPSGSGKSTYFNMIGALDAPTAGRVLIDEVDIA